LKTLSGMIELFMVREGGMKLLEAGTNGWQMRMLSQKGHWNRILRKIWPQAFSEGSHLLKSLCHSTTHAIFTGRRQYIRMGGPQLDSTSLLSIF